MNFQQPAVNEMDILLSYQGANISKWQPKSWILDHDGGTDMMHLVVVRKMAVPEGHVLYSGWWGHSKLGYFFVFAEGTRDKGVTLAFFFVCVWVLTT